MLCRELVVGDFCDQVRQMEMLIYGVLPSAKT